MNAPDNVKAPSLRLRPLALAFLGLLSAAVLSALIFAGQAGAVLVHPFKEPFGSAAQPSFTTPQNLAVDQASGALLVVDAGAQTLSSFKSNGEPRPFPAIGSNAIDAKTGPGGKPCAEEAASCDAVLPQNAFTFGPATEVGVAVDNAGLGSVTNGDIYVTQASKKFVAAFSSEGLFLGRLSEYELPTPHNERQELSFSGFVNGNTFTLGNLPVGCTNSTTASISFAGQIALKNNINNALETACSGGTKDDFELGLLANPATITFKGQFTNVNVGLLTCAKVTGTGSCTVAPVNDGGIGPLPFGESCGVGVDPAGNVYVGDKTDSLIHKFFPSTNPPTLSGNTANFSGVSTPCSIAAGANATNGFIFARQTTGTIYKLDSTSGEVKYTFAPSSGNTILAVDPSNGRVLVSNGSVVTEYNASGPSALSESTLTALSAIQGVAVDSATGNVYVSRSGNAKIDVFGPRVSTPTVVTTAASNIGPVSAKLNGTVNPEGNAITECKFEYGKTIAYGQTVPCTETFPVDSSPHSASATLPGLDPETTYHYRLIAKNTAGSTDGGDKTFTTSRTVVTESASSIAAKTATLNGSVNPVGKALTSCQFEYGLTTAYDKVASCSPSAGSIEADFQPHAVSAAVTGLNQNATYHFRLVVTNASGTIQGEDREFTTIGPPQVVEAVADPVGRNSATLVAKLNPSGLATTYHFEWGSSASYGIRIPADADLFAGSGTAPIRLTATVTGLQENTTYHFRMVASSSAGTINGPDREFTTLNSVGLPNNRRIELVSPADKRPVGNAETFSFNQLYFQGAENGESLGYIILNGLANSQAGGETIHAATRAAAAETWSSVEVTPPSLIPAPVSGETYSGRSGAVRYFSPEDLKCALVETHNPLTADTPEAGVENGVYNLYRWNRADDTYTLITNRLPLNPTAEGDQGAFFQVSGASADCSRIFFRSQSPGGYSYIAGSSGLYEWDNGILRDAAARPDGSIPTGGLAPEVGEVKNAVSPAGRLFFAATSNEIADSGKQAVFVRKGPNPGEVVNASKPTSGNTTLGAQYEAASPDGSHVFFLANDGLTPPASDPIENCSSVGFGTKACHLYGYDVDNGGLVDLSASAPNAANTQGAAVQGVMAVSGDGSTVYFAARGQLVLGKGRTYAQNLQGGGFANVYRYHEDEPLAYVGSITGVDVNSAFPGGQAMIHNEGAWTAQTNETGSYFLFASRDNMTGTNPAGVESAYLYSHANGTAQCVSCPQDGRAPHERFQFGPKVISQAPSDPNFANHTPRSLSEDGRVIFNSEDALTPNAVEGHGGQAGTLVHPNATEASIYEWRQGQIALLAYGQVEMIDMGGPNGNGRDVFIKTYDQLDPRDFDFNSDIYDFRSGGGFAPPLKAPTPCDPAADQCQGMPAPQPSPPAGGGSAEFSGPGNPPQPKPIKKCGKGKVLKQGKCMKKEHRKKNAKDGHKRTANNNRGGAK